MHAPTPEPINGLLGVITFDPPAKKLCQDTDSVFASPGRDTAVLPGGGGSLTPPPRDGTAPMEVPGFLIERVIGRGGMGTVYLARQLSLDRPVALKVMSRKWAGDPTFVARFTREAYAAARLNHPNLVQVYDIGEVNGRRFFSMEYVEGRSLSDLVRGSGKLEPEAAVGFILQAARGLKHAHDRGMIHRDIKPDNLLLDPHGLIKVADLGLVKTPDWTVEDDASTVSDDEPMGLKTLPMDMTGARMALGTPAYMSPEQCRDAALVDHRADIYSLGCTLYALVTGRQPFDGDSAVELMTKHAYTPLVPPEEIAARVPRELSAIIQKLMAKKADDRYQSMGEVIRVLEQWLGVQGSAGNRLAASDDQIAALEACVDQFHRAPTALLRTRLLTGFFSTCLLMAVVLTFVGRLDWAFGLAGLIVQAAMVYFVLNGALRRTYLYRRVRQVASESSVGDWLVAAAMLVLFAILLWMLKLFWLWVGFGLIGAALAVALRFGLDRTIEAERQTAIAGCERLLRRLRVQGLDEDQLRFFVAKYAGRHWEEFFEVLFGYEVKLEARERLLRGESAGERDRFAGWREPVVAMIDRIDRARREQRERRLLVLGEQDRLMAGGMTAQAARARAERGVNALLRHAAALQSSEQRPESPSGLAAKTLPNLNILLKEPAEDIGWEPRFSVIDALVGAPTRGLLAILCLVACMAWTSQNNILVAGAAATRPLSVPGLPAETTAWIDNANIGIAGVLLMTSLLYTGRRMGLLVLVGAAVATFAHRGGIPAVEPIRDYHVALMLGTVIALVGYRFGRR